MFKSFLEISNSILWSVPVLLLIIGLGTYLTVRSGFSQIRLLPRAFAHLCSSIHRDQNGGYRALCTALAATVGTGNLAGVAGAIAIGGPGVVFWMWICGLLGMVIKMAEVIVAVRFRKRNSDGENIGGPMYAIDGALSPRWHVLGLIYAALGVGASFGVGNATQINTLMDSIQLSAKTDGRMEARLLTGLAIALAVYAILRRGYGGIGKTAETLVPFAAGTYILLSIFVVLCCAERIPLAIKSIMIGAFHPQAVTGGVVASVMQTVRIGASRGVFTNEAGMGTASIAHASARTEEPAEQGLLGIVEVFLDTIVICTLTAMVILCSGIAPTYGTDAGITLTIHAFSAVLGDWVGILISSIVTVLAFATVLGWSLYGLRCAEYLLNREIRKEFALCQAIIVLTASVLQTDVVWLFSELLNGLMAIPNLIMLIALCPQYLSMIKAYVRKNSIQT